MAIFDYAQEIHLLNHLNNYNSFVVNENVQQGVSDEHIQNAYNSVDHLIKWCSMDSFAFACVRLYKKPKKIDNCSFIIGVIDTPSVVDEIIKTLNYNNSFMNGKYHANVNEKFELIITITEIS